MQKAASEGADIAGLLFGAPGESLVVVQAFKSVSIAGDEPGPRLGSKRLEQLILASQWDPEVSALDLIGWYCSRAAGGLHASDIEFHEAYFPHANDLALIVKPEVDSNLVLEFYSRTNGAPLSSEAHRWGAVRISTETTALGPVEIAMQTAVNPAERQEPERRESQDPTSREGRGAQKEDPARVLRSVPQSIVPERRTGSRSETAMQRINAGQLPGLPALRSQPKRRVPWLAPAIVCAVMAALTFAFLFVHEWSSDNGVPPFLRWILPDTGLTLRAEGQGDRLLLSWNRRNAVVRSASGGVLHIDDGSQHRDVPLDAGQVENGLVLYRPGSNDVTFRLEVRGQQGSRLTESVRVLDGAQNAPLELNGNTEPNTPSGADMAARTPQRRPGASPTQKMTATTSRTTEANAKGAPATTPNAAGHPQQPKTELPITPPILVDTNQDAANAKDTDLAEAPSATDTAAATTNTASRLTAGASKTIGPEQTAAAPSVGGAGTSPATPTPAAPVRPSLGTPQNNHPLAGLIPARPVRQVLPDTTYVSPAVLASHPQVAIVVQVDATGKVTGARVAAGTKTQQSLAGAALVAAKQWTFKPATLGGHNIESEHTIVFQFQPPGQ